VVRPDGVGEDLDLGGVEEQHLPVDAGRACLDCGKAVRGKPRCPGLEDHPAHPSADLVADHVIEVAVGGLESGPLRVLCRQENGRRSARVLSRVLALDPSPAERPITHRDGEDPGPVAA
jgi:hypothetical protein